jgi:hypothetical protein
MYVQLIVNYKIDSEAEAESPPVESPPVEFSDWDGFSDTVFSVYNERFP